MNTITKTVVAVGAAGLLTTAAACSSSKDTKPVGSFKTLTGQSTTIALDKGFLGALTALKLTPGVIGTAKLDPTAGTLAFPITGGNATIYKKGNVTPYVQGEVDHTGSGLSLSAGGTTVKLSDFVVHPGNDSNITGSVQVGSGAVSKNVRVFDLDGSTLQTPTISSDGVATLTGTKVEISPDAAKLLDSTFKTSAVTDDFLVGVATIKATGTA